MFIKSHKSARGTYKCLRDAFEVECDNIFTPMVCPYYFRERLRKRASSQPAIAIFY